MAIDIIIYWIPGLIFGIAASNESLEIFIGLFGITISRVEDDDTKG